MNPAERVHPAENPTGSLSYTPGYNLGIVTRETRQFLFSKGVMRGGPRLIRLAFKVLKAWVFYTAVSRRFSLNGKTYRYYSGVAPFCPIDSAIPPITRLANVWSKLDTERAVEIPVAYEFASRYDSADLLEVGNVLAYYYSGLRHLVVDKYEIQPSVINEDILTFAPAKKFGAIVSVSTIEHIGFDERPPDARKPLNAIERLKGLLSAGGKMLITVPLGYNPTIDKLLLEGGPTGFQVDFLSRSADALDWSQIAAPSGPGRSTVIALLRYSSEAP